MPDAWVFGYGSLVNVATHGYPDVYPAHLVGYRRDWRFWVDAPDKKSTVLTIEAAPGHEVAGMIARVPQTAMPELEHRESGYRKLSLSSAHIRHDGPKDATVFTFQSLSDQPGNTDNPIAQSYIDVVLKGFLDLHGIDALQTFFDTTDGWSAPVLQDRHAPIYARAIRPSQDEIRLFDNLMKRNGVVVTTDWPRRAAG